MLSRVGRWQAQNLHRLQHRNMASSAAADRPPRDRTKVALALAVLVMLIFSKYIYLVSLTNYYTFYLMDRFGVSVQASQYFLFLFLSS